MAVPDVSRALNVVPNGMKWYGGLKMKFGRSGPRLSMELLSQLYSSAALYVLEGPSDNPYRDWMDPRSLSECFCEDESLNDPVGSSVPIVQPVDHHVTD